MNVLATGVIMAQTLSRIGNVLLDFNKKDLSPHEAIGRIAAIMLDYIARLEPPQPKEQE